MCGHFVVVLFEPNLWLRVLLILLKMFAVVAILVASIAKRVRGIDEDRNANHATKGPMSRRSRKL